MKFSERSYNGKMTRPTPEIHLDKEGNLLIIATPWGPRGAAKKAIQIITDYYVSTLNDVEITVPFERLSCLSSIANNLRIASLLANNVLYREDNRSEYIAGVELFSVVYTKQELVWVQLGHPYLFLQRSNQAILPLGSHVDLSMDLSSAEDVLSPLPNQMIGLDPTCNIVINSFRPRSNDKLILLSRSTIPTDFYNMHESECTLHGISQILARNQEQVPFWLGVLEI